MAGKIPRSFIDDLLVRVDIVDLVDTYVPLKKTGSSYVARCPFHTEKTPSFAVTRISSCIIASVVVRVAMLLVF